MGLRFKGIGIWGSAGGALRRAIRARAGVAAMLGVLAVAGRVDKARAQERKDNPEEIRVAAAISLREAFEAIAADFEKETRVHVALTFGSSGQLLAQIRNGAPVDVFVSAGNEQADALEAEGLVKSGTRRVVAGNRLVLIVPRGERTAGAAQGAAGGAPAEAEVSRFEELSKPQVKRVAIGDPNTVPAGQYAAQVLEKLHLLEALKERLVYGTNVRQVLDYVVRGEVSAGLVYATDARTEGEKVTVVATADAGWHKPIEYPAVVLKASRQAQAGERFLRFLGEAKAGEALQSRGFSLAQNSATRPAVSGPAPRPAPQTPPGLRPTSGPAAAPAGAKP